MVNQRSESALRKQCPLNMIGITLTFAEQAMADIVLRNLEGDIEDRMRLRAELKRLAADIRALSAGRRQTPSEDLLRESRDER